MGAAATFVVLLSSTAPVAAWNESAAPQLDSRVLAAWHDPQVAQADQPWHAFLQVDPAANVSEALFQVCRVGKACFAPPAPAQDMGNATFGFASSDAGGGPAVDFQPGWRIGIKWYLRNANGSLDSLPPSPEGQPVCADSAALECQEAHYLAFDLMPAKDASAAPGFLAAVGLLAVAARRRHG